jgi:hypothetical protein
VTTTCAHGPVAITPALGGGLDTVACGTKTTTVEVVDRGGGTHNWSAGRETCTSKDAIGLHLDLYRNKFGRQRLVFFGFGQKFLGNQSRPEYWNIGPGDPIEIYVFAASTQTTYTYNVTAS